MGRSQRHLRAIYKRDSSGWKKDRTPAAPVAVNHFLVMAGQSGAIAKLTNGVAAPGNIQAIDTSRVKIWNAGTWQGYVAGTNSAQTFDGTFPTAWGQEAEVARNWLAKYPLGTLYIVKHTADGTHIMSTSGPDWNASPLGELLSGLNTKVTAALANLAGAGVTLSQRRAIWDLGSSDALDAQSYADAFYANMLAIYNYQRTNWGIGKITHVRVRTQNLPYAPIVRAAQNRLAFNDANLTLINVDDLTLSDLYHFAPAGTVTVGARAWDALENGTSVETTNAVPYDFSLGTDTGVALNSAQVSDTITVDGLTNGTSTAVTVSGGPYSKNGGAPSSAATTAVNGDQFYIPVTASGSYSTGISVTLTIGGKSSTYTATTLADPGVTEDADVTAFFNAVATAGLTAPPTGWRAAYDTFVKAAKANANWWAVCDFVGVLNGYDAVVSRRNLKQDLWHLTLSGTPVFTAKAGFDCTNGHLLSVYNPASAVGRKWLQDDAHYGVSVTDTDATSGSDFSVWSGAGGVFFTTKTADTPSKTQWRLNSGANTNIQPGAASPQHDWVVNRVANNAVHVFVDTVDTYSDASASIPPVSATVEVGGLTSHTPHSYDRVTWGGGMSQAQITQRNTDFANFKAATASL